MGDVWPVPGRGEAASLLGTSPEQRKRSMPSSIRGHEASGCLRVPPLWETSGQSLVAVGLRLSWGRLRSSEIAAYRRAFALVKPPAALGFLPLWETSGLSLAAVRLRLSWGRLRSSENAACRRALANWKPPAGLGFPPMGDVCVACDVWCVVCDV